MPYFRRRRNSDSDYELEEAFEGIKLNEDNEELYAHHTRLRDAVVGTINIGTKLIALHNPIWFFESNHLLHDCTRVAKPAQLCQILRDDGNIFPPAIENGASRYYLYHTYDNLLLAPLDRLECRFFKDSDRNATPYLTVVIEFHFNKYNGRDAQISDYKLQDAPDGIKTLTFSAGAATSKQLTLAHLVENELHEEEREILALLESFTKLSQRQDMKLLLHDELLTPEEQSRLYRLRERLPGGLGNPLPSFGHREYAPFRHDSETFLVGIGHMLEDKFKHPLVPLGCHDAIATLREWVVSMAQGVLIQHAETDGSLRLVAKTLHQSRLYAADDRAILAVKFQPHKSLDGSQHRIKLPSQLSVELGVTFRNFKSQFVKCDGFLVSNSFGLPHHDAFFLITSHSLKYFKDAGLVSQKFRYANDIGGVVKMKPHYPSFFLSSQIDTIEAMTQADRWHQLLLNQIHKTLEKVNLVEDIDPELLASAYKWLRDWADWNAEQLGAIDGLDKVLGGMMLIMGPAGTGKTLLFLGLSQFFYRLGLHIAYFAPANKNVNQFALQIRQDMNKNPDLNVLRINSPSRDIGLEKLSQSQAAKKKVGHDNREVCSWSELLIAMEQQSLDGGEPLVPRLEDSVLKAAVDGKEKFMCRLKARDLQGREYFITQKPVDAWEEFGSYLHEKDSLVRKDNPKGDPEINKHNRWVDQQRTKGMAAYRVCKKHILGRCRFIIATLGNTRCAELMNNWFTDDEWAAPRKGVIVFIDECHKALEVDVWAPIVCESWADSVKGVIMAGDEKQLPPVNTSSQGVQFNPFNARLNTSLPERLINMGFPCYRLSEQYRMHPAIAKFPGERFYGGKTRDGPGTDRPLEQILPGLADALRNILTWRVDPGKVEQKTLAKAAFTDERLRLQWLQVEGKRIFDRSSKSMNVVQHVHTFFDKVLPELQTYFRSRGLNMADHLMIICAYGEAISDYSWRFKNVVSQGQMMRDHVPRVLTVDSSQGQEADMVIFDGSCQANDAIGFMNDSRRCNVAVTRAKHVFWIIGGAMMMGKGTEMHHLTKYKRDCDADRRTVRMSEDRFVPLHRTAK